MTSVSSILHRLEAFPQDLSDVDVAALTSDEVSQVITSLSDLGYRNRSPEARNSLVQVAALLPPDSRLESTLLDWALDAGADLPMVTKYLILAFNSGRYDSKLWIQKAITSNTERLWKIIVLWAPDNFDTFLTICHGEFKDPSNRINIVTLLQTIILSTSYSPDSATASTLMYRLATHVFFSSILRSLLVDTSNRLFPLTLWALATTLPFALQPLTTSVPLLMVVLGRAVCWRDRPFVDSGRTSLSGVTTTPPPNPSFNWSVAQAGVAGDIIPPTPLEARVVRLLLISLYGAWPSNIIAFARDPAAYLSLKGVETVYSLGWNEIWEPGLLAARILPLLSDFQLHPSIISFTSAGELSDDKRWDKYDASEFVSRAFLLSRSENLDADSIFEFFKINESVKQDLESSLVARRTDSIHEMNALYESDNDRLREENRLLRLESLFGERMRKQYLFHIGRLHKNSLRFNSDEAEIHTFVNRIKEQSKSISTLTQELSQQRTEASQAQQKHVKWQEQLRDKVSAFREERRHWQSEATQIRGELSESQATVQRQREELAMVKNERFQVQNQLLEVTPKIQRIEDYETRIRQLTDSQRLWDSDLDRLRDAESSMTRWQSRCYELENMLRAREKICEEQADIIQRLEDRVVSFPQTLSLKGNPRSSEMTDSTFYVNVAENARKRLEKLERENLELQVEIESMRRSSTLALSTDPSRSLLLGSENYSQ